MMAIKTQQREAREYNWALVRYNAYRILGLSGDADYPELLEQVDFLKQQLRSGKVTKTDWDLPWAWPLDRTALSVDDALRRLSIPATRIVEKLYWFSSAFGMPLPEAEHARNLVTEAFLKNRFMASPSWIHDAAVLSLLKPLMRGSCIPGRFSGQQLDQTRYFWNHLIQHQGFWQDFIENERQGGFPNPATAAMLRQMRRSLAAQWDG